MPKFNVYLLTTAVAWEDVEAPDAKKAEVDALFDGGTDLSRFLQAIEGPYRIVVEEIEDDDEEEEVLDAMDALEEADAYDIED